VLDRHVSTQCVYYETYSCACSHTKRRLSVHFLTYEVMPMRNVKHITLCLSHNFPQMQSKQSTKSQLFNLRTLLTMQLLTYKDVSVRKLSHRRTCPCATYHVIFCFISTTMFPRSVLTTRRVHAHVRTSRDGCVHNFWLMNSCLCVTLNISHLVCHIIFLQVTRNKVPHHDFLTYEPFSLCKFWLTRTSPCTNCHIWGRVCLQHVTKFLTFYLDRHVSTNCVDYETCSCACSRTKKTYVCTLFELERHVHA